MSLSNSCTPGCAFKLSQLPSISMWSAPQFCQYQMVGPWAWHHSRHHCYLWHSFYWIVYPQQESKEVRAEMIVWVFDALHLFLSLCFPSVFNPARAPAAPRMASPKAQDTSCQNYPLLLVYPSRLFSTDCPHGQAVVDEANFTLLEWSQWQWCLSWVSAGTHSYLACFSEPLLLPTCWQSNC